MGADKNSLVLGDRTLLEAAVDRVSPLVAEVIVVVGEAPRGPVRSARIVTDVEPGIGPLMGLYSGLQACTSPRALLVAPDMPFPPRELLATLARVGRCHDIAAARLRGRVEPLCAVYSRAILPVVERCLTRGERSFHALYEEPSLRVLYLDDAQLARWGDPDVMFWNINTVHDFEEARRLCLRARTSNAHGPRRRADRVALETVSPPVFGKEIYEAPRSIRARHRLPSDLADGSM